MTGETEERSGAIDSVTVTARRPLSDIGIQKTVFDETLLHLSLIHICVGMKALNL